MEQLIFEVIKPGSFIEWEIQDKDKWHLTSLILNLEASFFEANVALNFFNSELSSLRDMMKHNAEEWNRASEIKIQLYEKYSTLPFDERYFKVETEAKKMMWSEGYLPSSLNRKNHLLYAKMFLYSIDSFLKTCEVMSKAMYKPTQTLIDGIATLKLQFPHLTPVRNAAHHMEDYVRGIGMIRGKKQEIQLKPINNNFVNSESGALIVNSLNGNKYSQTMADGHLGEIEVSAGSLETVRVVFQNILDSYNWSGHKQHLPM
ncbi:hypothetical protein ACFSQ3_13105 [Sphingobacterium corticis]|uniref:Cthe-2314-like HEPN domain-containing protein n=1 Tax=Sphingobacterium corticis TaxID=1812823 RepID=A0ABW5NL94_9SPHI